MVVRSDSEETRERILDEGLRRFAAEGAFQARLRQIGMAAGQRNTSVVQYHFGDRNGLIRAIIQRQSETIAERRNTLLAQRPTPADPIDTARAIFQPLTEMLDGDWRDLAYIQLLSEVTTRPGADFDEIESYVGGTTAVIVNEAIEEILATRPKLPRHLRDERIRAAAQMTMHTLGAHASLRNRKRPAEHLPSTVVLANLCDMYVAALCAPPSPAALAT